MAELALPPIEVSGGPEGADQATGAAVSPEQAVTRDVAFNPTSEPAAPSTSPPTAPAPSGVASEYTGVIDYARSRGLDVTGYADDAALMNAMTERMHRGQQEDYYSQLGRQLAPRAEEIRNYLSNATQNRQPAAPAAPAEWERPQFDQRWAGMVDRDPLSGMYLGKPGTPPAITEAVNKFAQWQERYGSDPLAAVRPYVEAQLPQVIQQQVSQALAQYQTQQATQQIIASNAEWMYQADESGRPVYGVGGQRMFTEQGRRYGQYVQQLESNGMRDPRVVDATARQLVMSDINAGLAEQYRSSQPAPAQAVASRPQVNPLQSLRPQVRARTPAATEPNQEGMSLHDRLAHAVASAGFTDADFVNFNPE